MTPAAEAAQILDWPAWLRPDDLPAIPRLTGSPRASDLRGP